MSIRVLCVDDDLPILKSFRLFPWEKYYCEWVGDASNGQKALSLLPTLRPDLILVDICMPILNGLDFILLAHNLLPSAHFIILSAHCDFEYARKALRFGVSDYLIKGEFTDEELGKVLLRFVQLKEKEPGKRYEVEQTLLIMEAKMSEEITLENVAEQVGISPNYLGTLFYQQTGQHFREKLTNMRMERARELLQHSPLKVYEIAQQVGIQNTQYFITLFQKTYGQTPGQLRRG